MAEPPAELEPVALDSAELRPVALDSAEVAAADEVAAGEVELELAGVLEPHAAAVRASTATPATQPFRRTVVLMGTERTRSAR